MADKQVKWTEQQKQAIGARGGNVFVTASAGTGKTAVLSGRCVSIISEGSACPDVMGMLILTFTEAAAEQMHARIAQQLREAYHQTRNPHLLRQLILLQGANISTIHAFCKRLITENFHKLALDPAFRIIDSDETMLLKGETLEETIEWAWQQNHLVQGLHELLYKRDLRGRDGFLGGVIRLAGFLEGIAAPDVWCDRAQWLAEQGDPAASELGRSQQQIVKDRLGTILAQLRLAKMLYEDHVPDGGWGLMIEESLIEPVTACLKRLNAGNWQACADGIRSFPKPQLSSPKGLAEPMAEVIKDLQKKAVEAFLSLNEIAILNPSYLDVVGRSTSLQTRVLVELVRRFGDLYAQRKSKLKGLDFADLERYTLRLLTTADPCGERLSPSETALALRKRFKCIFVDEYQDINPVQQAILDALSSGNNVFVVGDVKQSIYAWRGAEPAIFLERLRPASLSPKDPSHGFRVDLNYNFRSARGILDFVNKLFGRIMTAEIAHINYDETARLQAPPAGEPKTSGDGQTSESDSVRSVPVRASRSTGILPVSSMGVPPMAIEDIHGQDARATHGRDAHATETPHGVTTNGLDDAARGNVPIVELHILDEKSSRRSADEAGEDEPQSEDLALVNARQRQAALIARRIREMVGAETGQAEFQVPDRNAGALRNVEYRDIVILMRSLAQKANDYVEILRLAGIPVSCDATAGYFEATEVRDMLSVLKVLDNPKRDIELATVLRSAFFHVTDTELATIRIFGKGKLKHADFHTCAVCYRDEGPDLVLKDKLTKAFERLDQWRSLARRGLLASLVWRIYRQSGFLAFVSALPNGQARKANLLRLHDRAVQFEGFASDSGVASLTRFVDFLERLQDAGQDWAPAQPGSAAGNAVRILSVHKSKGLEFPIVFLAELETQFNKQDIYADLAADADSAIGLQVIDSRSNTKLRSLAHEVIGEKKLATMLAEEMRVLYVATTRARDRLILTASQKRTDCGKILAQGLLMGGEQIPAWLLRPCKSALEWVLYGLSDQRVLHSAFQTGLADTATDQGLFDFRLHGEEALKELSRLVMTLRTSKAKAVFFTPAGQSADADGRRMLAQVKSVLKRDYPHAHAIHLAAKSSVTKLTHQEDMFVQRDYSEAMDRQPVALVAAAHELSGSQMAKLVGTAAHLVVSSLDLKRSVTLKMIEKTRDRLVGEGAIPESVARGIDTQAILAFFESHLGEIVCDSRHTVWQEWPFTYGVPACEAAAGAPPDGKEIVVVQGLIDLLVRTSEGLIVIDFKTDHVSGPQIAKRTEAYRGQLDLYAKAASAICSQKVLEKWLYFFAPRQGVQI
jgi:ATP-dependent helicase/nuclease subunit A